MLGSVLTALNIVSFGYSLAKRILKDIKGPGGLDYKEFKKLPRSKQRDYVQEVLKEKSVKDFKDQMEAEIRQQVLLEIQYEKFKELGGGQVEEDSDSRPQNLRSLRVRGRQGSEE